MSDYDNCSTLDEAIGIWKHLDPISERTISGKAEALILQATKDETLIPVVRCKDCKYYYAYPDEYRTCHEHYEIDGVSKMMGVDDFCSKGERKEHGD